MAAAKKSAREMYVENPDSEGIAKRLNEESASECGHGRSICYLRCGVLFDLDGRWHTISKERRREWLATLPGGESAGQLLDNYFALGRAFSARLNPDLMVLPLSDQRTRFWFIVRDIAVYCDHAFTPEIVENESFFSGGAHFGDPQRVDDVVVVAVDTQVGRDSVLAMVFDPARECTDQSIIDLYVRNWR